MKTLDSSPLQPAFATPSLASLQRVNWDFAGCKTNGLTHSLHPYPAKYIPQIPRELIEHLSKPGDSVADIFCGSGTTLVESLLLDRFAVGIDANPLACLISRAKTTQLKTLEASQLLQLAEKAKRLAENITPTFVSSASKPAYKAIEFWFAPFVAEELAELVSWCRAVQSTAARELALVAFSSIVVAVSLQDSDTRYVRREKNIVSGDTLRRFARALEVCVQAASDFSAALSGRTSARIYEGDIRTFSAIEPFDLMVCSPPYPNAYSYHLYHMTRMVWLGMDQPKFKKEEIGSHRKYSSRAASGATPQTFQNEMRQIFAWLRSHLRPEGFACFVVGDSTIRGERIDNAQLLAEVAALEGFAEVERLTRTMQATKKSFNPVIGRIKEEKILVLRHAEPSQ